MINVKLDNNLDKSELLHFFVADMEDSLETNTFLQNNLQERILYFTRWIRGLHGGGYTYLEAIIDFCDKHDIEYEDCTKLISPDLKGDVYLESIKNNRIKNDNIGELSL